MATTTTPTKIQRRWRVAATAINFITHLLQSHTRKKRSNSNRSYRHSFDVLRASSRVFPANTTSIDIPLPNTATSSINLLKATHVSSLVRDKNHTGLIAFGGINGVLAALCTDSNHGISGDSHNLSFRAEAFESSRSSNLKYVLFNKFIRTYIKRSYNDIVFYTSYILSFGVRICSQQEGWKSGAYMLLIAIAYSILSSVLDFGVEKYLDKSVKFTNACLYDYFSSASVIRSSSKHLIPASQIVVGDVILLKAGETVPADGLLIDENPLTVSEFNSVSNMNTEMKNSANPFLYSGSRVIEGSSKMVVTAVGTNTRLREKQAAAIVNHSTPLQVRVRKLISVMKKVSFGAGLVVLIVMLARYFSGNSRDQQGNTEFVSGETRVGEVLFMIMRILLVIITIGLAMDSESYLWVVKICQGSLIKKMAADGVLVRKLSALEKMGLVTSIVMTEKTYELTGTQLSEFQEAGVSILMAGEKINNGSDVLRVVRFLKQRGHVVALFTHENDEIIDLLALEESDVTVFVSNGSHLNQRHKIGQLANSYDVYITNVHDFASVIIKLLMHGRSVLDNTQKLVHFQFTAGVVSLLDSFICAVSRDKIPTLDNKLLYSLLQLVWVNLILGLLAAIALSREQPQFKMLQVNSKKKLIYGSMWRNIVAQVIYQITLIKVIKFKGGSFLALNKGQNDTISYVIFFSCQVLNMFNARKVEEKNVFKGISKNRVFMVIIVAIVVMQIVFVEILHKYLGLEKLDLEQKFKGTVGIPFASLVVAVVVKLVPVPN